MMKTKYSKLFLAIITLVLCVLLFLQRLTGGIWHAVLGILLIIVAAIHLCKQNAKLKKRSKAIQVIDWALIALLVILFVSGMLLHPLHELLVLKIIHKVSAVLFVLGVIAHIVQHVKCFGSNTSKRKAG